MRPTFARMMLASLLAAACTVVGPGTLAERAQPLVIHHDLVVTLDPPSHRLKVRDRIRVPGVLVTEAFTISLNAELNVQEISGGLKLVPVRARVQGPDFDMDRDDHDPTSRVPVNVYRIEGARPGQDLAAELNYEGVINYPIQQSGGEYARAFSQSPGLIEARGVYLAGSTYWVPQAGNALVTYSLAVEMRAGWKSLSQGERPSTRTARSPARTPEGWSFATPTEEVHLIAAPFTEYSRDAGAVIAMAFLRKPDQALADRYLNATAEYLEMYRALL